MSVGVGMAAMLPQPWLQNEKEGAQRVAERWGRVAAEGVQRALVLCFCSSRWGDMCIGGGKVPEVGIGWYRAGWDREKSVKGRHRQEWGPESKEESGIERKGRQNVGNAPRPHHVAGNRNT